MKARKAKRVAARSLPSETAQRANAAHAAATHPHREAPIPVPDGPGVLIGVDENAYEHVILRVSSLAAVYRSLQEAARPHGDRVQFRFLESMGALVFEVGEGAYLPVRQCLEQAGVSFRVLDRGPGNYLTAVLWARKLVGLDDERKTTANGQR